MRKTLYPQINVLDEKAGIVEYIASDEATDGDKEIIRLSGWDFSRMEKNAPFINSHASYSIENQLGCVLAARTENNQLIETVQWAIDVAENKLAQLGWAMTRAKYLKAVSVGFIPISLITRLPKDFWPYDWQFADVADAGTREGKKAWQSQATELKRDLSKVKTIFTAQTQTELSVCLIGCNPNAVAKAYKAGVLTDADLETLSTEAARRETADSTADPADVEKARQRARTAFLVGLQKAINKT